MVNVIGKEDLLTMFVGIGIKRFLLTNDNFCDIFAENRIGGVVLRGICYLDSGDGIKTQILIKNSGEVLCKDEDVIPSSIFYVDNDVNTSNREHIEDGDIELFVINKIDMNNVNEYDNIIKSLGYKYVSNVNEIVNCGNEYLIKEYIN